MVVDIRMGQNENMYSYSPFQLMNQTENKKHIPNFLSYSNNQTGHNGSLSSGRTSWKIKELLEEVVECILEMVEKPSKKIYGMMRCP